MAEEEEIGEPGFIPESSGLVRNQEPLIRTVFLILKNTFFLLELSEIATGAQQLWRRLGVLLTDKHLLFRAQAKLRTRIETSRANLSKLWNILSCVCCRLTHFV